MHIILLNDGCEAEPSRVLNCAVMSLPPSLNLIKEFDTCNTPVTKYRVTSTDSCRLKQWRLIRSIQLARNLGGCANVVTIINSSNLFVFS